MSPIHRRRLRAPAVAGGLALGLCVTACADRAPPPNWPDPPPPLLAEPIGQAEPSSDESSAPRPAARDASLVPATGDADADADEVDDEPQPEPDGGPSESNTAKPTPDEPETAPT